VDVGRRPGRLERPADTFSGRSVTILRQMVVTGRLRPGERLNEVQLAGALGISRGPLREAIQRLHSEGLVSTIPNRGAFVRTFSAAELTDLYEVRIALETHAVRLVGSLVAGQPDSGATRTAVLALQRLSASPARARAPAATPAAPGPPSTGPDDHLELDVHHRLVALAGNPALLAAAFGVRIQAEMARAWLPPDAAQLATALVDHDAILEHLAQGRAEAAALALADHLRSALATAVRLLPGAGNRAAPASWSAG
jgi:DNA-binding GntR family transcriptional regulator